jgi:hypothetical protein
VPNSLLRFLLLPYIPLFHCDHFFFWLTLVRGPTTAGYEVQNLPPLETSLQSFGHAAVSPGGDLTIQLIDITGQDTYETTMKAAASGVVVGGGDAAENASDVKDGPL